MNSMTGYGQASWSAKSLAIEVAVRSVNNRFLKVVTHMPEALEPIIPEIEEVLRRHIGRGTVHVEVHVRNAALEAAPAINEKRLAAYFKQLRETVRRLGMKDEPTLSTLLALPGVLETAETGVDLASHGPRVLELVDQAAKRLSQMRCREGRRTAQEMRRILVALERDVAEVRTRAPRVPENHRKRLLERLNAALAPEAVPVTPADLARELAVYCDRCDISEELQRLESHLREFHDLVREKGEAGKKLDFLTQELLREANTIGSKANDAEIAQRVIEMKSAIEKLKEQVQNVE